MENVKVYCTPSMGTRNLILPILGKVQVVDNCIEMTVSQYEELSKVDMGISLSKNADKKDDIGKRDTGEEIKRKSETAEPLRKKEEKKAEPKQEVQDENSEPTLEDKSEAFNESVSQLKPAELRGMVSQVCDELEVTYSGSKLVKQEMIDFLKVHLVK